MFDIYSAVAWLLVLCFGFVVICGLATYLLLFVGYAISRKGQVKVLEPEPEPYERAKEEFSEESEFDGLLGIDGETEEEREDSALFPPEYEDLLEDET